jgi:acyl-coenzyme A thioesterase PaaI-like protein
MQVHMEPDRAWSDLTLDATFQGWEGIAHGGILATLLDEAMAWATASRNVVSFTARMNIVYRKPTPVGMPIRVDGWVVESRRRLLRTEATIVDPASGDVLARADGVYVAAPEDRQRDLRDRYRLRGALDAPDGSRRWRVVQSLPPVEPLRADPARPDAIPTGEDEPRRAAAEEVRGADSAIGAIGGDPIDGGTETPGWVAASLVAGMSAAGRPDR